MLKTQLDHGLRTHCKPALCLLHQQLSPFTSKGLKPFVFSAIFLFRTRSLNKILCHLLTPVVFPCLVSWFFPLSSLPPRGMILLLAHSLSAGILFPLQWKMASISSFFTFMSFLLFVSLLDSACLAKPILVLFIHFKLFVQDCILFFILLSICVKLSTVFALVGHFYDWCGEYGFWLLIFSPCENRPLAFPFYFAFRLNIELNSMHVTMLNVWSHSANVWPLSDGSGFVGGFSHGCT